MTAPYRSRRRPRVPAPCRAAVVARSAALIPWLSAVLAARLALPSALLAQTADGPAAAAAPSGLCEVNAVRVPNGRIVLDGRLAEPEWQGATPATGFVQQQPREGAPTTEPTEIRFLYDDDNLYVGGMMYDERPDRLVVNELKRDFNARDGDLFVLVLDTFDDKRNAYGFQTNPGGALRDTQSYDDGRNNNQNWDAVWAVHATVAPNGWTLEYAIPFKSLRFPRAEQQTWGVQLFRLIRRKNEITVWSPVPRQYSQFKVSYAGVLRGIEGVEPGRNIRLKPFAIGSAARGAPGVAGTDGDADGGLDLKMGLGSNLVLDATWRTDFSQVEADEQQINLTRFTQFFPEKRAFFLENVGTFQMGPPLPNNFAGSLQSSGPPDLLPFFSRTIGLTETGTPLPLFGGLRLSGKLGRTGVGVMDIQTERDDVAGRPATNYSVVRVQQEFLSNSAASVFYMGKERGDFDNRIGGADVRFNLMRTLDLDGLWMRSTRTGTGEGDAWRVGFNWDRGLNQASASYTSLGTLFRDELGFIPRIGVDITNAALTRRFRPAATYRWVREYRGELAYARFTKDGVGVETQTTSPSFFADFADGSQLRWTLRWNDEALTAPFRIRPSTYEIPTGRYRFRSSEVELASSRARRLSLTGSGRFGDFWNGARAGFGAGGRLRFSEKLATSFSYGHDRVELPGTAFSTDLVTGRVDGSFSTRMFLNAFVQYNSQSREVATNVRFDLIHHPLSDLFVVYNETRPTAGGGAVQRAVILKVTQLLSF